QLVIADHSAVMRLRKHAKDLDVHALGEKAHTAVTQESMATAWMLTERLVVRSTVVGGPRARRRTVDRAFVIVDVLSVDVRAAGPQAARGVVCGGTGNTAADIRIGPTIRRPNRPARR